MALGSCQLSHLESYRHEPGAHQGAHSLRALFLGDVGLFHSPTYTWKLSHPKFTKSCLPSLPMAICMSALWKYTWTPAHGYSQLPVPSL